MLGDFLVSHLYLCDQQINYPIFLKSIAKRLGKKKKYSNAVCINGKHVEKTCRKKGQRQEKLDIPIYEKMSSTDFTW